MADTATPQPPSARIVSSSSSTRNGEASVPETLKRKRDRDKDNQRRKRQREREYTASLEHKIACLERELSDTAREGDSHAAAATTGPDGQTIEQRLSQFLSEIRRSAPPNGLSRTATGLVSPVTSSGRPALPDEALLPPLAVIAARPGIDVADPFDAAPTAHSPTAITHSVAGDWVQCNDPTPSPASSASHVSALTSPLDIVVSTTTISHVLSTPEWLRIPFGNNEPYRPKRPLGRGDRFAPVLSELRTNSDLLAACDEEPKVIDLLFGGSSNRLANIIEDNVAQEPTLPPERLASSWLIYLYIRWLAAPSVSTFNRIPTHFRPTPLQLLKPHSPSLDLILWPQVRENFIRHGPKYDRNDVFGLLSCTCRIRGAFNGKFVVRENDGDPQIDPTFYHHFMSLEAWGIMETFWTSYPELVEGLDPSIMIREEHLMPST